MNNKSFNIKNISDRSKFSFILFALIMISVFIVVLSSSYAMFTTSSTGKDYVINTGSLQITFNDNNTLNLTNLYPMKASEALADSSLNYNFTVRNTGNIAAKYRLRLELDDTIINEVPLEYIRLSFKKNTYDYTIPVLLSDLNSNLAFTDTVVIYPNQSVPDTYILKVWIDYDAPVEIAGKEFKAKIIAEAIQNVDEGFEYNAAPTLTLNKDNSGNIDINLRKNQTYTELGVASVKDDRDVLKVEDVNITYEYFNPSTESLETASSVDTSKVGVYYVKYSATDSNNITGSVYRIVTVNNSYIVPTISLKGDSTINLLEQGVYEELGVNVASGNHVVVISDVKMTVVGTYTVKYVVIDNNGNINSVIRTVNVTPLENIGTATFELGSDVNGKMKRLAGNPTATYASVDSNIKAFVRSDTLPNTVDTTDPDHVVSDSSSEEKIYMWYDNGTIYYYTKTLNPKLNVDSGRMFAYLTEVENLSGIAYFDTSEVESMRSFFYGDSSLERIDLSNFDTSSVEDMYAMFYENSELKTLDLSSFNTSNVSNMRAMFAYCTSLTDLNLSSFNTSNVNDLTQMFYGNNNLRSLYLDNFDTSHVTTMRMMFYGCYNINNLDLSSFDLSSLESSDQIFNSLSAQYIKTPKNYGGNTIYLSTTYYDSFGNAYSALDSTSPTQTNLRSGYVLTFDYNYSENNKELVASYDASEIGNVTGEIQDLSGNGHVGILNDVTIGSDYLEFNGTTSWINLGQINNDYIAFEIELENNMTGDNSIHILSNDQETGFSFIRTNIQTYKFSFKINDYVGIESNDKEVNGQRVKLAGEYDGSYLRLYIDDQLVGNRKIAAGPILDPESNTVLAVGTNPAGNGSTVTSRFKGKLYSLNLYKYNLDTKVVAPNGTIGTLPTAPERDGYTFLGWYTTRTGGVQVTTASVASKDTTYYAHWQAN